MDDKDKIKALMAVLEEVETDLAAWARRMGRPTTGILETVRTVIREVKKGNGMKISADRYNELSAAMGEILSPAREARYKRDDLSAGRYRWDSLHESGFDTRLLYDDGLNDEHIDTALRAIVRAQ